MKPRLSRRDFLKLAGLVPLGMAAPRLLHRLQAPQKNVIVVVFDAWSAYNVSRYGYPRLTTPNIDRLSKRALVYHNHFAGGNFTTSGTASLLTGTLPWTHRAINPNSEVAEEYATRNIFSAFPDHYRIAYTHNGWAFTLLKQASPLIDELIPRSRLMLDSFSTSIPEAFKNDDDIASVSWIREMEISEEGHTYSLFLSQLYNMLLQNRIRGLKPEFPRGLPTTSGSGNSFLLETAADSISRRLTEIPQPFLGYFHFLPPHYPYNAAGRFVDAFRGDHYTPPDKPVDLLARRPSRNLEIRRREYDEFVLYCDEQFGRLYDQLEASGLLDTSLVVLTSDHGEMFERGITGHSTDTVYQPVSRVPLMIFEPGRETGADIHEYTSAADVLSTIAFWAGQKSPDWGEGVVLPPFSGAARIPERNVYLVRAVKNPQFEPLRVASVMLVRENYKLHYYFGYDETPGDGLVKLYDIAADPDEMVDLAASRRSTADELLQSLKADLAEKNKPYL